MKVTDEMVAEDRQGFKKARVYQSLGIKR
jgi:CCR4-NOT transcriptional regulation complex NOT5 subunit